MNFKIASNGNLNWMGRHNLKFRLSFAKSSILWNSVICPLKYRRYVSSKFLQAFHTHSYTVEIFIYQSSKDKRRNRLQYGKLYTNSQTWGWNRIRTRISSIQTVGDPTLTFIKSPKRKYLSSVFLHWSYPLVTK